jgi:hypothetical protein
VSECEDREKLPVPSFLTQKEDLTILSPLNSVIKCKYIDDSVVKYTDTIQGFVSKI